jgi:phosphate transport system substrate-binding protein
LLLVALFPRSTAGREPRNGILVKGSDTMLVLMREWALAFSARHPEVNVQVTGGGTGTGMAALINRTTEICMASRPIRIDEVEAGIKAFRRRPHEYQVALGALVVYVNAANPVREISLAQLSDIFTGRVDRWTAFGGPDLPIALYSRENSSGTYEMFKERILEGADFAASTQTMPGNASVLAAVARDPAGIGYGGVASEPEARPLAIREAAGLPAVLPTLEAILTGTYPLTRHLLLYVNPAVDRGSLADFIGWIRSEEGQRIAEKAGYHSLRGSQPTTP